MTTTYNPRVFEVNTIAEAMRIILTPEGASTAERWEKETPYLADLFAQVMDVNANSLLLDYGCGIGRLSHELINKYGCRVVGLDISPSMRAMSVVYARSDRFMSCSCEMIDDLIARGVRFDAALSIWVLQHCLKPAEDIARICNALRPGGELFVVNGDTRAVPTVEKGWVNDTLDIKTMLAVEFEQRESGRLAREKTTELVAAHSFWAKYRKPV